ncbi:Sec-independent protein translocase TatA [Arthrobacter agilis]|uniref:Sec-independent protein translocase protein TatA n=1 Tax=Arthrobacter agilis TaxID=37921 RepID=A0A2L0UJP9_9MICC|nr:twin-arginine translocase TatA/TatE family subunit [Arthrobacter agilis]AUZ89428.1 Sec-independent protein translocase TatA [Arthrobacter agilis]
MLHNLTGWHALILFAVVLLFFGAAKLPGLARSIGQSVKIFKTEAKDESLHPKHDADAYTDTDPRTGNGRDVHTGTTGHPPTVIRAVAAPDQHRVADAR